MNDTPPSDDKPNLGIPSEFLDLILWARIKVLVHATEDLEKVEAALSGWLSRGDPEGEALDIPVEVLCGTYGNPIRLVSLEVRERDELARLVGALGKGLPPGAKSTLASQLGRRFDKKNIFHLRLDKDLLVKGRFDLSGGNDVVLELKFKKYFRGKVLKQAARDVFHRLKIV
ncbi:MAG: RNA-binding domain-containing protein [Promethearchaeota archaeon]